MSEKSFNKDEGIMIGLSKLFLRLLGHIVVLQGFWDTYRVSRCSITRCFVMLMGCLIDILEGCWDT